MADTEFQIGDVVYLKTSFSPNASGSNTSQRFVVSSILGGEDIRVTWFNYDTKTFSEITLDKRLFVLAYRH